jgi:hypothetical protein
MTAICSIINGPVTESRFKATQTWGACPKRGSAQPRESSMYVRAVLPFTLEQRMVGLRSLASGNPGVPLDMRHRLQRLCRSALTPLGRRPDIVVTVIASEHDRSFAFLDHPGADAARPAAGRACRTQRRRKCPEPLARGAPVGAGRAQGRATSWFETGTESDERCCEGP